MNSKIKSLKWHAADPAVVCHEIARVALGSDTSDDERGDTDNPAAALCTFGKITLREHQRDALVRVKNSIREFRGALLADVVGLGKTYVALALARDYFTVHVLAPATLLPMWRSAISATEAQNVTLHSLHRLSRGPINTTSDATRSLVIVDEAHHLRTRKTSRYNNAIAFTANRDVLLLTATPLHNETRELRNLLALFLGRRADALDNQTLAQCVVRRTAIAADGERIPAVREHPVHRMPDNPMVLECLLTLPPPLPVHEGAAASALVRLGLLRAWCSSDAALTDSIRRRQLRGEALLHSLAHGRYPTQRELRSWIVGNDAVQLGFPELLVETASKDSAEMLKTLLAHLDGLQALLQLHTRTSMADARRAELLRSLVGTETLTMPTGQLRAERRSPAEGNSHPPPAIVAFSQFASTVRALHRALSDLAGIALLTSDGGRIASGAIARHELIASFAPKAHGRPPPREHERIRLLLTTDLLAEGVNLQDASQVVHLDLPWTDALRQQRVGRLARMGSVHAMVDVYTFEPPIGAEAALRIVAALERKAGLHRQFVGMERVASSAPAIAFSGADEATQLREHWRHWQRAVHEHADAADPPSEDAAIAFAHAESNGWIAAVEFHQQQFVIASLEASATFVNDFPNQQGRYNEPDRAGTDTSSVWRAVSAIQTPRDAPEQSEPPQQAGASIRQLQRAMAQLQQWIETHVLHESAGPMARSIALVQRRALETLSSRFAGVPSPARATIARLLSDIERQILNARGASAELALEQWMLASQTLPIADWLASFPSVAQAAAGRTSLPSPSVPSALAGLEGSSPEYDSDEWHLIALLILQERTESAAAHTLT